MASAMDTEDVRTMADGCVALFSMVFGEANWYRWNEIKQLTQVSNLSTFVGWLLDLAEQEIHRSNAESNTNFGDTNDVQPMPKEEVPMKQSDDCFIDDDISIVNPHPPASARAFPATGASAVPPGTVSLPGSEVEISRVAENDSFFCGSCNVTLSDIMVVEEHCQLRHINCNLCITCCCCSTKYYAIRDYVDYHKQQKELATGSGAKNHVCSHCAKGFREKQFLEDHINSKHLKLGPRHQCVKCNKRFSYACDLSKHKKKCPFSMLAIQ